MINGKKVVATIEARMTSSRLPGKVLLDLAGKPALQHIVERLRRSNYIDDVVVATTINKTDDPIINLCDNIGCKYYRGSEEDVLLRVLDTAKSVDAELLVEITGDCPVIDHRHTDQLIELFESDNYDYVANTIKRTYPRGFDTQVFPVKVLEKVNELTKDPYDHEHVSVYIYTHPEMFKLGNIEAPEHLNHPELEITLDTKEDYELISRLYRDLYPLDNEFSAEDVVKYLLENTEIAEIVKNIQRKNSHLGF
ncbi:MAG: glycosyltransferase family protein [Firmicutes bacterium]|jgi:spore coat polysaccharide biosynthesis protein SpsF|nr:glycosyltransferase family protein [Bacillota bacterium]